MHLSPVRSRYKRIDGPRSGLHIYASIAEQERKMIGERIKAAIGAAKRRGRKYGLLFKRKSWQRHVSALGRAALIQEANDRAKAYRVYVEWALKQPGLQRGHEGCARLRQSLMGAARPYKKELQV